MGTSLTEAASYTYVHLRSCLDKAKRKSIAALDPGSRSSTLTEEVPVCLLKEVPVCLLLPGFFLPGIHAAFGTEILRY